MDLPEKEMHPKITYDDLNWHELWQNARSKKSWTAKGPADWDKKASSFAARNSDSPYVSLVLEHLPIDSSMSILDAGSGPGTLSLPLAQKVQSVTALDYSQGMLEVLRQTAAKKKLDNITTILGSWEDNWDDLHIGRHDICIASRSLSVANLQGALGKLNDHAKQYVFVADRISPTPFDPGAFQAVGRPFRSGPDYIYTINTLYSMGIHPCVDIISLKQETSFSSEDAAFESYSWMFKDMSKTERESLRGYLRENSTRCSDGSILVKRAQPPRWALIWWKTDTSPVQ